MSARCRLSHRPAALAAIRTYDRSSSGVTLDAEPVDSADVSLRPRLPKEKKMRRVLQSAVLVATLTFPALAHGQGTVRGAEEGAAAGGAAGGPIGAIVGGTVGAATGTVGAILGVDDRPRFREYVVRERVPSYTYREDVRVGAVLPEAGVTYYEVPA